MGECLIIRGGGGTDTSNATATASVVLSGYTCYVNDQLIAGSMPVQTLNQKLGAGGSVTIPAGYYDGSSSVISTSTLAEETAANAASSHILSGYNGWVNGGLVQGSMANWGNTGATLAANGVYWIPAGWHAGAGVVNQGLAVHWGGTYTPNTGNQVMCWAGWYTGGNIVVLGSSALVSGNIRNGVWIFGVLGNFTGWVDNPLWLWNGSTLLMGGATEINKDTGDVVNTLWVYSEDKDGSVYYRQIFDTAGQYNTLKLSWYGQWMVSTRAAQYIEITVSNNANINNWYISGGTDYRFGKSHNGHYNGTFEETVPLSWQRYFNIEVYSRRGWCWVNWIQLWK